MSLQDAEAQLSVRQRFRIAKARSRRLLARADAHTEWMNECVPELMDGGKDQDVAVAACLNMWRDAWEESHPDGAVDPGPERPSDDKQLRIAREKLFDESQHPRDEHGRWTDSGAVAFISPNVADLKIDGAIAGLNSARQEALRRASAEVDVKLGKNPVEATSVVGAWSDGAENSLQLTMPKDWSFEQAKVALAMKGWLGDQKSALVFKPDPAGNGFLASFPMVGQLDQIHQQLLDDGLEFHTLEPTSNGALVHIFGEDQATADAVDKVAGQHDAKAEFAFGNGAFIGTTKSDGTDREQRDDARRAYEAIIADPQAGAEFGGRDIGKIWQDLRARWGGELSPEEVGGHALTSNAIIAEAGKIKSNSVRVADVAKQVNERAGKILQKDLGVDHIDLKNRNDETDDYIAGVIAQELKDGLTNGRSAVDWYDRTMKSAMASAEKLYPGIKSDPDQRFAYTAALAISSQGEVVESTVRLADLAYKHFAEHGKFPTDIETKDPNIRNNLKKVNGLIDKMGLAKTREFFNSQMTSRDLKKATGVDSGLGANDMVYGSAMLGPKIGQGFYQNLNGNFSPITMDMWFMRAWGRLTNTGIGFQDMAPLYERFDNALKADGRKVPKSEDAKVKLAREIFAQHEKDYKDHKAEYKSGERKKSELVYASERIDYAVDGAMVEQPSGVKQRQWITEVFHQALDKLNGEGIRMQPASAQATWWWPEQVLYDKMGARVRENDNDYAKSLKKLADSRGLKQFDYAQGLQFAPWIDDPDPPDAMTDDEIEAMAERVAKYVGVAKAFDPSEPRDDAGKWTSGGGSDADEKPSGGAARPKTVQGKGATDAGFAKITAAVAAIPPSHAAQIAHVPVVLTKSSDDFPSHIAAGGGASTVGLFSWANDQPRVDVAEAIKFTATITEVGPGGTSQSQKTESLLPVRQPEQVTVHELAHAFDYVNGWKPSDDAGLKQNFSDAVAQMTDAERGNANYWISGGQREMFAELYSAIHNPNKGSDQNYFGGMTHQRVEQVFAPAIAHVLQIKRFDVRLRSGERAKGKTGWFVNAEGRLYALLNGMPYEVDVTGTPLANMDLVPGEYADDAALQAAHQEDDMDQARLKSQWAREKARSIKLLGKLWDESQHPRVPAGGPDGGQFGEGGGGGGASESARREGETDKAFAKRVVDKRPAPKELPEQHEDYFKMDGATVMPLDKLVSSKSDTENKQGGDNGAKRMAAAAKGELAKRDPITVEPMADGKYLITDGNGTFTTVQKYGWEAIPVKIDHSNYKAGPPGLKAEASTMKRVREGWINQSPIETMDDMKREAPKAQATLGKVGNAIAAKLGVQYMHPTAKTQKIDKATGEIVENPKGVARILEKVAEKEAINNGNKIPLARITDATRGTFVLNHPSEARKVIDELSKSYEMIDEGWRTIPDSHYTDRPLLFRDPATGLIGEIQLSHPDLLNAKDHGGGHEMYEEARSLPNGSARKDELNGQMQRLYGAVLNNLPPDWRVIDGRRGYKDRP